MGCMRVIKFPKLSSVRERVVDPQDNGNLREDWTDWDKVRKTPLVDVTCCTSGSEILTWGPSFDVGTGSS